MYYDDMPELERVISENNENEKEEKDTEVLLFKDWMDKIYPKDEEPKDILKYISSFNNIQRPLLSKYLIMRDEVLSKTWNNKEAKAEQSEEIMKLIIDLKKKMRMFSRDEDWSIYCQMAAHYENELSKFIPSSWNTPLALSHESKVNGYNLYSTRETPMMDYSDYLILLKTLDKPDINSFEDFFEKYDTKMCTDWSKMDREGECFGGHWKFPNDSDEYKNAYNYHRKDNALGLYELPYHKEFILKVSKFTCLLRRESVRYTNFFCHWILEKRKQMEFTAKLT